MVEGFWEIEKELRGAVNRESAIESSVWRKWRTVLDPAEKTKR